MERLQQPMGRIGGAMSLEEQRHRCEVRELIRAAKDPQHGRAWVRAYLDHKAVAGRRERLRADLNEQIKRGNSGEHGEWLD